MFYTVIEIQDLGSSKGVLSQCYDSEDSAYSDYFTRCASAAVSQLAYHAVYLICSNRGVIEMREFTHES